ncbi:hypothetical protein VQ042_23480 [Aurantimonas sp. A2-1-M11]|uniref:DUF6894 family protein n=1 Tax=Aurantimonas sp. A2-1-M11 TaxID=3113712 RepID=UPI002F93DE89
MPLYFFDIQDRYAFSEDDVGVECETREKVRDTAFEALPGLANSALSHGDHHTITVTVRDEAGTNVLRASLKMDADWLDRD